jgi:hypothetical protein
MSGCDKTGNGWVDAIKQEMAGKDCRKLLMTEGRLYKT